MVRRYVLDSSAVLIYLQDQPGADLVERLIIEDDTELAISAINLAEVLYIVQRLGGELRANEIERVLLDTVKIRVVDADWDRIRAAARIKADGGLSFPDCFAVALAEELQAAVVTSDVEFRRAETARALSVVWLGQ